MIVIGSARCTELELKRLYLPGLKLRSTRLCKCNNEVELDLEYDYLSYPKLGERNSAIFYCHECEDEWEEDYTIEITIRPLSNLGRK
jgi:hypothetical protein